MEAKFLDHIKLARAHKDRDSVKKAEAAAIVLKEAANTKWQESSASRKEDQKRSREI